MKAMSWEERWATAILADGGKPWRGLLMQGINILAASKDRQ
jgi:hypothetical protein